MLFFCGFVSGDLSEEDRQSEVERSWNMAKGFAKGPWSVKDLLCEVLQLTGGALMEFVAECTRSHWPELTERDEELRSMVHSAGRDGNWNVFHLEAVCRKLKVQMLVHSLDEGSTFVIGQQGPVYHLLGYRGEYLLIEGRAELWSGRNREATPTNPPQFSRREVEPQSFSEILDVGRRREEYEELVQLAELAVFPREDSDDVEEAQIVFPEDQADASVPTGSEQGPPSISGEVGVVDRPIDDGSLTSSHTRSSPLHLQEERTLILRSRQINIKLPLTGLGTNRMPNSIGTWKQMDVRELPPKCNIKMREPRRPICKVEDGVVRCQIPHCPSPQRTFATALAWKRHVLASKVHQREGYCHQCGLQLTQIPASESAAKSTLKIHRNDECPCATKKVQDTRRKYYEEYKAAGIDLGHIYVQSVKTSGERRRPAPCTEAVTSSKRRRTI